MKSRRYSVQWMEVARRDIEIIAAHLSHEAPLRAEEMLDRIIDRGDSLTSLPERGRRVPELRDIADRTWREVQEPPWRMIYRVSGRVVEIYGVFDARRHLDDVLRERIFDRRDL